MKLLNHLLICSALIVFAGCGKGGDDTNTKSIVQTTEENGVRLTLAVGKPIYRPGESVEVTATVENRNDFAITYSTANLQDPPVYILLDAKITGSFPLYGPSEPRRGNPAMNTGTIDPKQIVVREVLWDQMIAEQMQAPPGQYTVQASLLLGDFRGNIELSAVEVEATFAIEGSEHIISQEEALQIAIERPEVHEWYEVNGSDIICSLGYGRYVGLGKGELREASPDEHIEQDRNGRICLIELRPGPAWEITFASKRGASPGEFNVFLDATDGSVLQNR